MKGSKVHPSDESQNSATSADEQDDVSVKMNGTDSNKDHLDNLPIHLYWSQLYSHNN